MADLIAALINLFLKVLYTVLTLALNVIITVFVGGITAWLVNVVAPDVFVTLNSLLHTTIAPWTVGATLGFIRGFFRG